ncbi:hypothetical protein Pfo_024462 [Paulownia fortunei]|nr:hypothetical protein Pfo_024462 [Paulownia fortunei]
MEDIRCHISNYQAYRAKRKVVEMIKGIPGEQYSLLWDYADKINRTISGSTVIIGTCQSSSENRFDRFHLYLYAVKMGFFTGCRPFIGVDGCHLKGPYGGVLITAVGINPNNNIYPVAYVVVNKECWDTWD